MQRQRARRSRAGRGLVLLVGITVVLVVLELNAIGYAYGRLGLSRDAASMVLLLSLWGSWVNVPLLRREDGAVIAVNVGGALVPLLLSLYLTLHAALGWRAVAAVAMVAVVARGWARPVAGVGIVVPMLVPPVAAYVAASVLGGSSPAAVAFVGGTIGTLVGADLLMLRRLPADAVAPVLSIGGAGTFDGVFLAGIVAVLLAAR